MAAAPVPATGFVVAVPEAEPLVSGLRSIRPTSSLAAHRYSDLRYIATRLAVLGGSCARTQPMMRRPLLKSCSGQRFSILVTTR